MFFRSYFYAICCPLLPSLLRGRRHRAYTKKHEIPLVFVGRKPNVPFTRSARSKQISEGTRSKNRWKISSNKEPTGPETKQQKTNIFEAKMAPRMDPGDLQKRVRKTISNSGAQKGLLDASGAAKQNENRI